LQCQPVNLLGLVELALVSIEVPEVVHYVELLDRMGRYHQIYGCPPIPYPWELRQKGHSTRRVLADNRAPMLLEGLPLSV
jgi:hypothetical protein